MGLLNFEPKTNRFIIVGIIIIIVLFIIGLFTFLIVSVNSGTLTSDDIVRIMEDFFGILDKESGKVILKQ